MNDVCSMMETCKPFYAIARDGRIWKSLFLRSSFSKNFLISMKTNPKDVDLSANLDDWYNIYKFVKVESTMTVKDLDAIDLGRYFVKFASKKLENSMSYGCVVCEKYSYKKRCKKKKKKNL